ncbi:LETM1-like protein [Chytriomyces sp. MP71]|nr:LETM1-like protein [Chytriomyces sp. MP71]
MFARGSLAAARSARTSFLAVRPLDGTRPHTPGFRMRMLATGASNGATAKAKGGISGLMAASKAMFSLYWNGSKQLLRNAKAAGILISERRNAENAGAKPSAWTRDEFLLVHQTTADMKKLAPFLLLVLIIPESIPFVLTFSPSLIPSTCVSPEQRAKLRAKLHERRAAATRLWLSDLDLGAASAAAQDSAGGAAKPAQLGWIAQVPRAQFLDASSIVHLAKHARAFFEPKSMERGIIKGINAGLGLRQRAVFAGTLRGALERHWVTVRGDDRYLAGKMEGQVSPVVLEELDEDRLRDAAEMRGISTVDKSREEIEGALRTWLEISMNKEGIEVPAGLMFLTTMIRQVKDPN